MKTVLAPNAPWPKYDQPVEAAKPVLKPKPKAKTKPKKKPSKIAKTTAKYLEWAGKTLGTLA
jgi:hypothetical protein